jgi:hypothetical protein
MRGLVSGGSDESFATAVWKQKTVRIADKT